MASRPCIRVAYTARAVLPTTHELDSLAERTLRELRRLGPFQRDAIIERLLRGHGATAVAGRAPQRVPAQGRAPAAAADPGLGQPLAAELHLEVRSAAAMGHDRAVRLARGEAAQLLDLVALDINR